MFDELYIKRREDQNFYLEKPAYDRNSLFGKFAIKNYHKRKSFGYEHDSCEHQDKSK
jgi:hypothetical protein